MQHNDGNIGKRCEHVPVTHESARWTEGEDPKKQYRTARGSGNKTLMYASMDEIRFAVESGRTIEAVVEANRRGLLSKDSRGANAYRSACNALGVSPVWDGRQDEDKQEHGGQGQGQDQKSTKDGACRQAPNR